MRDEYARVYIRIADDPKFATVFDDDASLALWLRLLLLAEATFPSAAPIPATARKAALNRLVKAELVDLVPGGRFRIHGLEAERARRVAQSVKGGKARAANAAREGGKFTSRSPAGLVGLDQRSTSRAGVGWTSDPPADTSPAEPGQNENEYENEVSLTVVSDSARDRNGLVNLCVEISEAISQPFSWRRGSRVFDQLEADVASRGIEVVRAACFAVIRETTDPLDSAGVVFGAHKRLFPIPSGSSKHAAKGISNASDLEEAVTRV